VSKKTIEDNQFRIAGLRYKLHFFEGLGIEILPSLIRNQNFLRSIWSWMGWFSELPSVNFLSFNNPILRLQNLFEGLVMNSESIRFGDSADKELSVYDEGALGSLARRSSRHGLDPLAKKRNVSLTFRFHRSFNELSRKEKKAPYFGQWKFKIF